MAGEEPHMKKRKSDVPFDERNQFPQFHGNKVHELKSALSSVQDPLSGYVVAVSKIEFCDAKINKTFSKATCTCKDLCDDDCIYPKGYSLINIFHYGIDMFEAFIRFPLCFPETL
jgi:hypothetical protein